MIHAEAGATLYALHNIFTHLAHLHVMLYYTTEPRPGVGLTRHTGTVYEETLLALWCIPSTSSTTLYPVLLYVLYCPLYCHLCCVIHAAMYPVL